MERQKWLYSVEKSRKVLRRWQGKPEGADPTKPPGVAELSRKFLRELAGEGDPYAAEILRRQGG